ncbi:flagellar export chaperone FliS [Tumebacillus flagellatus]|uniref:Flagellar secretion chaperone FliS n=1 Tax=Tumebacillus flagellatus TaxID=1157490 RepID=A0A074LSH9_9BACL|nr:flagellar export chaperone FliS [Tumebacillus flagellatus]KEO84074.1 flagellar biosynthesis protein FliS [Tumebacillus flagellatus]
MMKNPYQSYSNTQAMTATPGELTLMLFNGAIRFLKQASIGLEDKDYETVNTNLLKAQNILLELMSTLKMEYEVAQGLMPLYQFMYEQLVQANIKKNQTPIQDVIGLLEELRDTWNEAIKLARVQQAGGARVASGNGA